jgi:serine phosphatase RsbU (regulator of sigma subunit)
MFRSTLHTFIVCLLVGLTSVAPAQHDKYAALLEIANRPGVADTTYIRLNMDIADAYLFNNPDTSCYFVKRAAKRAKETGNVIQTARTENYLGIIAFSKMHYLTALEHYQTSQNLYLQGGDKSGALKAANNIANVYTNIGETEKAVKIYQDAYLQNVSLGQHDAAASNLYNTVVGQLEMKQYGDVRKNLDQLGLLNANYNASVSPDPLWGELYLVENKLDLALTHLMRALERTRKEQDEYFEASVLMEIAEVFIRRMEYSEAEEYMDAAEKIIQRNEFNEMKLSCLEKRAEILFEKGLAVQAYDVQKRYLSLKDSLDKNNNFNRISELNAKYESEKRETEIARQAQLIQEKDSHFQLVVIIGLAALLVAGIVTYSLIRNRKMTALLKIQNKEIKTQRQKIISSINYAKKIQSSILPPMELLKVLVPESFIYFKPRDIVSGDFYWYQEIDRKLYIATVDCTGHGVPGAFMSLIANAKLNKVLNEMKLRNPGDILKHVHLEIMEALHQSDEAHNAQDGMDMSLCVIDFSSRTISFSGANTSMYLINQEGFNELKSQPLSIGGSFYGRKFAAMDVPFDTVTLSYDPGDRLFMFTDGFADQIGGDGQKKLNKSRFRELLSDLSQEGYSLANERCDEFLRTWKSSTPQTDDILLLGLRL